MYKILKGQSEAVNPRKADNTITNVQNTNGAIRSVNPRKADNTIDKCTRY